MPCLEGNNVVTVVDSGLMAVCCNQSSLTILAFLTCCKLQWHSRSADLHDSSKVIHRTQSSASY